MRHLLLKRRLHSPHALRIQISLLLFNLLASHKASKRQRFAAKLYRPLHFFFKLKLWLNIRNVKCLNKLDAVISVIVTPARDFQRNVIWTTQDAYELVEVWRYIFFFHTAKTRHDSHMYQQASFKRFRVRKMFFFILLILPFLNQLIYKTNYFWLLFFTTSEDKKINCQILSIIWIYFLYGTIFFQPVL